MKRIFATALLAVLITACQKENDPQAPAATLKNVSGVTEIGQGETLKFEADITSAENATLVWIVDGEVVEEATDKKTFEFSSTTVGAHTVEMSLVNVSGKATGKAELNVFYLMDFEDVPENYLAGPTSYGDNLYDSYADEKYFGYTDVARGLEIVYEEDLYNFTGPPMWNFWSGGIAISRWNDKATDGSNNQCSVYFKDPATGFGGYGGSKTFAVDYGNHTGSRMGQVAFTGEATEGTFRYMWVNNSTYAALSMLNGEDAPAKKFETGDWFKLIIKAEDAKGNDTGTPVEFYLADFREGSNKGVVKEWTKVDLTPLGSKVHRLIFDLTSSDNGPYGMNTPGYFCFDNLAFSKN